MSNEYTDVEKEIILKAKKKAMHLLEYSDRTEKQLRDKLEEGEFPPFAVDEAIQYVQSFHYLDDGRLAENYVLANQNRKSVVEMKYQLKEKGVSSDIIDAIFSNYEFDTISSLKDLFFKKYSSKDLSDPKTFEKAIRYFCNKGYSYSDVKKAISLALEED